MKPIGLQSIGLIWTHNQEDMPIPDTGLLQAFKSEVTDQGPEACLPVRLNDLWLLAVLQSADEMHGEGDGSIDGALAMAALLNLLEGKQLAMEQAAIDLGMVLRLLSDYRIELALEMVHRRTEVRYEPATLLTIFTNRVVDTWID